MIKVITRIIIIIVINLQLFYINHTLNQLLQKIKKKFKNINRKDLKKCNLDLKKLFYYKFNFKFFLE